MTAQAIPLGFEVGTGEPVAVPLKNLAVTGQTQESGKTTTLEALATRFGGPAIAFVTKRGEGSFAAGRRLQPYFRERADWQFVDQLLEAQLREKNKFLRPWLIRICRTTSTLAEVHAAVKQALKKAKGLNEGVYTQLDAYLELIVPEIARARLAKSIDLQPGLNVMDVSDYAAPMQMLFVQSAIDWVNDREKGVVVIVPEAWEFIPEGRGSPVKASAVALVRKGSGIGNHIWVDSQDMAGVDKVILRGCPVWLIGAQREANEIKRNLANIPAGIARPKPGDIARLGRGEFYACFKDRTVKTYVRPAWMEADVAKLVAVGETGHRVNVRPPPRALTPNPSPPTEEPMSKEADAKIDKLTDTVEQLVQAMRRGTAVAGIADGVATVSATPSANHAPAAFAGDEEALYQRFKARLRAEAPALLKVLAERPELQVKVERVTIEADGKSLRGRLAQLIASDFFAQGKSAPATQKELARRGNDPGPGNTYKELDTLAELGFLTIEQGRDERSRPRKEYHTAPGAKVNVIEK